MALNRPKVNQKTALVTGVSHDGIGGALARELHAKGYFVICTARRDAALSEFQLPEYYPLIADVMNTKDTQIAAETVSQITNGKLDVLINNAGIATHIPALDLDIDGAVHDMFNVNVLGVMRMVQSFSGLLIESRGTIVNIGSIAPIVPTAWSSAYNATKAALHSYGDSLSMELKPFDVKVVTMITGSVRSGIVRMVDPKLPEGSRYNPVKEGWLRRVNASQSTPMATDEYAKSVVAMLTSSRRPLWMWQGGESFAAWFSYFFLPKSIRLWVMMRRFGLWGWRPTP